jgi:asparagine synthase (glutamine-hydrolysing)
MCGIAGLISTDALDDSAPGRALAMRDSLAHRGPDEEGLHTEPTAILAHRRLSIVDLRTGQQPLSNEDGTIWIAYNGEVYNHAALRLELEALGHRYRTRCDTETIVHAYEQWGDDCVTHFRGMFAFAVWDERKRRLLLARDRLGIKPLYWARCGNILLFGSEIKSILASGLVAAAANEASIPELLSTRSISSDETMFQGVFKVLPGHLLIFERGQTRTVQYWDLALVRSTAESTRDTSMPAVDVVARFRELLEESVRLRLMSDVPLGLFLSGGIDSSAIAAIAARQIDRPLQTFSVAFEDHAFSELPYARAAAAAIGAEGHEVVVSDRSFFEALPRLLWHEDEPIAHTSSIPLYFVSALARRRVTVVLTGEGSDELLAGYGKYLRASWNWRAGTVYERLVPKPLRDLIAQRLVPAVPGRIGRYARRSWLAMDRSPEAMLFDNFAAIRLAQQARLLTADFAHAATRQNAYGAAVAHFQRLNGGSTLLDRILYADIKTYLVELLMKQDQMSMAASIESRVPFLDHKLVEFAAGLPDRWKLSGLTTKRILRQAMKGLVPDTILNRPKMGFPVPFSNWMRAGWNQVARDVLLDRRSRERGIIDPPAVDALLRRHAAGHADEGDRIWGLLNLELWYRTFIDKEGVQMLPAAPTRRSQPRQNAHSTAASPGAVASAGYEARL